MMTRAQFRYLVATIAALLVIAVVTGLLLPSLVPESVRVADEAQQQARMSNQSTAVLLLTTFSLLAGTVATVVALAGLYFFRRWSLWLNAALIAAAPLFSLPLDYQLISWVAAFLMQWLNFGLGAALAIAWFTPLRSEFK